MCQVGLTTMVLTTPENSGVSVTWVLPTTTFELPGRLAALDRASR